ncbi:hypothetical protein BHM03_00031204 [Ensete ventricosum]|nr:hypothetical protein BHM03_00031204 [Ensete ventricosum]
MIRSNRSYGIEEREKRMGREIDTGTWLRFRFGGLEVQADGETSTISGSWVGGNRSEAGGGESGTKQIDSMIGRLKGTTETRSEEGGKRMVSERRILSNYCSDVASIGAFFVSKCGVALCGWTGTMGK